MRKAVFLDRDGTLIEDRDYLRDPAAVRLLPGVVPALTRLKAQGWALVVVTNQSGVARGLMSAADVAAVNAVLVRALPEAAALDGIYVCPHGPEEGCACRKPRPGMLERASRELGIAPERSWIVGDKADDLRAGRAFGCRGILVLTGHGQAQRAGLAPDDVVTPDLPTAVDYLLAAEERA